MNSIIFGSQNPAKVAVVALAVAPLGLIVRGLDGFADLPHVVESGETALDNARIKATIYAAAIGQAVFSIDSGLYIVGLPAAQQPGLHVRRIPGSKSRPTDEKLLAYYRNLSQRHGGKLPFYWEFALCRAEPDGTHVELVDRTPIRYLIDTPSSIRHEGHPLDSITYDPEIDKVVAEMNEVEQDEFRGRMVRKLFEKLLAK